MKYTTCDFAPKNAFSRKLTFSPKRRSADPAKRFELAPARAPDPSCPPLVVPAPFAPVGPGDEPTVLSSESEPPHDAKPSTSARIDSVATWRMWPILAPKPNRPIQIPGHERRD